MQLYALEMTNSEADVQMVLQTPYMRVCCRCATRGWRS